MEEFKVDGKKLVELIDKLVTPGRYMRHLTETADEVRNIAPEQRRFWNSAVSEAQNTGK